MPKSIVPDIHIDLDRPRTLRFTNWARCQAEREISSLWHKEISIYEVLTRVPIRAYDLSIIFWQCLCHEDPSLSLRDAIDLMDYAPLTAIMDAVLAAWNIATPADTAASEAEGEALDPPPVVLTGEPSGVTPAWSLGSATTSSGATPS